MRSISFPEVKSRPYNTLVNDNDLRFVKEIPSLTLLNTEFCKV
jgi:hypothetical protein